MRNSKELAWLTDEERGIDPLEVMANDCSRVQNTPLKGKIPAWWLEEGTPEQVAEWQRQIKSGEAELE